MAVLKDNFLVGKVVEVNYLSSRALLLSDLNSKIPVIIEPGSIHAILSGTGKEIGVIEYIKNQSEIDRNSIVYTSGSGGIFKSGIPIGKLEKKKEKIELNVEFLSDFSQLEFVRIVSFEKGLE